MDGTTVIALIFLGIIAWVAWGANRYAKTKLEMHDYELKEKEETITRAITKAFEERDRNDKK